jgi:hypothetical protein
MYKIHYVINMYKVHNYIIVLKIHIGKLIERTLPKTPQKLPSQKPHKNSQKSAKNLRYAITPFSPLLYLHLYIFFEIFY